MQITREDAEIIVQMDDICCNEGICPDNRDLLRRIMEAFGEDIVPEHQRPADQE